MEKHPRDKGTPRPLRDRASQVPGQPEPPLHDRHSESPEGEGVAPEDREKTRDKGAEKVEESPDVREDKPSQASFHHGSTTQAGSDYGQGSNDLPDQENRQGSESNGGSNYDHEKGWKNEALRKEDID